MISTRAISAPRSPLTDRPARASLLLLALLAGLAAVLWSTAASAQSDAYRIQAGDVLRIEVLEDNTLNRDALVLPDGRISMPLAGSLRAAGRTLEQVRASIAAALSDSFALAPSVFVSINRLAPEEELEEAEPELITVYVLGEARNPGALEIEAPTTVLQLFAQVGGFTNFAALRRIQLRRVDPATGRETLYALDFRAIERGESTAGLFQLRDGDVIVVPQRRLFE
jgi:polysaccharide export outer membrane protein